MQGKFIVGFGALGSGLAYLMGGFDEAVQTLVIFMVIDYITGMLCAGVFHKSPKTESGALESRAGFKGLIKKCMILFAVIIGHRTDMLLNLEYIRNSICFGFMANELLSIVENFGLMGINYPPIIKNAIELFKEKEKGA